MKRKPKCRYCADEPGLATGLAIGRNCAKLRLAAASQMDAPPIPEVIEMVRVIAFFMQEKGKLDPVDVSTTATLLDALATLCDDQHRELNAIRGAISHLTASLDRPVDVAGDYLSGAERLD